MSIRRHPLWNIVFEKNDTVVCRAVLDYQRRQKCFGEVCVICQQDIRKVSEGYRTDSCGHAYHWKCLLKYLYINLRDLGYCDCPQCRQEITYADVIFLHLKSRRRRRPCNEILVEMEKIENTINFCIGRRI